MGFKICTIGCGGMATRGHGPAYKKYIEKNPDVRLAACCDIDEVKAISFKNEFGFERHYTDFELMLECEKPDAVCLIVPVHLTAQMAVYIMEKGYPLLLEKPPGLNREETLKMAAVAKKNNVPNQVAFNRRFMPLVRRLKNALADQFSPDEIQNIQCNFYRYNRYDADFSTTAIHGIDTVRFLAGAPYESVRFHYQEVGKDGKRATNIFMDCRFRSGATAQLSFCPTAGVVVERYTVNILDHTFFLDTPVWDGFDAPGRLVHINGKEKKLDISGSEVTETGEMFETNGFYAENEAFFNDIRAGRKPVDDIMSSLQSVEIADSIRRRLSEYKSQ